ncbi:uncharacterized protein PV09_04744 [Verruconis gallopava]|uniref:AB hydrolase-1 domain-containing protein n=1 Tax=Verruconis gallopava TaxID=253628 RepID=A0A0D1XMU6_9PEZI|nr:uncharacterized protein PV09_04744 [Verruconis gallopava]KIW03901.1 hypothetical protein PV09_04744 [Verruconis gallopava]
MEGPKQTFHKVNTNHAVINVRDSIPPVDNPATPLILLLHGNSFCLKIWKHIFSSDLARTHRIVAIDYPGHGDSSDAYDARRSYNQAAYADAALQVLKQLAAPKNIIVVGWSLGGHVAIEIVLRCSRVKGIVITGTPPVDVEEEVDRAFNLGPTGWRDAAPARNILTEAEMDTFAHHCADPPYEDWMLDCVKRTDGRAREYMFQAFADGNRDAEDLEFQAFSSTLPGGKWGQKKCVETSEVPVAVINGDDPFLKMDWFDQIKWKNLWGGKCIKMDGCLHAPFWGKPQEYQRFLEAFVRDVS